MNPSLSLLSARQAGSIIINNICHLRRLIEFSVEQVFSIAVHSIRKRAANPGQLAIWVAAAALIAAGAVRYIGQPSFWLDEAFVAVSLQHPSAQVIFAPLEYGQFFPRLYLIAIALVREIFGYSIWALRLVPFLCFSVATIFWARLLVKGSRSFLAPALLGAALFIGASFWLDQSIQLKQYTFDVLLALIPFLLGDEFFTGTLARGRRKSLLIALALPALLSYTYPMALGARLVGWYLDRRRREGWTIDRRAALILATSVAAALVGTWFTDYRYNFRDLMTYQVYWNDCILSSAIKQSAASGLRLVAKLLWGWHGRQPLVTAGMVPLQIIGVYSVIARLKNRESIAADSSWGSRSVGSIVLLVGVIFASAFLRYPICAPRLVLFAQVHTQVLAIEGALFIVTLRRARKAALVALYIFIAVVIFHSGRDYVRLLRADVPENLQPVLPRIKPEIAGTVWVHSCSVAQVRSLPGGLPVERVLLGAGDLPRRGEKVWVIWTHLGAEYCRKELDEMRARARVWQVIDEGADRGLALAEF